jgi:hypothetical protein
MKTTNEILNILFWAALAAIIAIVAYMVITGQSLAGPSRERTDQILIGGAGR